MSFLILLSTTCAQGVTWDARYMPGRKSHAMAYENSSGRTILFSGGGGSSNSICRGDTWVWDGTDWTELNYLLGSAPAARSFHAMTYDAAHGKVVLFGGYGSSGNFDETWTWDAGWTPLTPIQKPAARNGPALAYDRAHDETVLFGGWSNAMNDTWTLNLSRLVFLPLVIR